MISRPILNRFAVRHPIALAPLMNWYRLTKAAAWASLTDVRRDFGHADVVGRRTIFNIHGNDFRLIARVNYETQRVFILFVLTHAEYTKGGWKQ